MCIPSDIDAAIYTQSMLIKTDFEKREVIKVVLLDELKVRLSAYEEPLKDLGIHFDLASKKE